MLGVRHALIVLCLTLITLPFAHAQESFSTDAPKISEPERNYDLIKVTVRLKMDVDEKSFAGEATNLISPLFDGITTARFDAVNLDIESVKLNGTTLEFRPFEDAPRKGIEAILDRPYNLGEKLPITITYSGKNPKKGLYFVQPTKDEPNKPYQIWTQGEDMDTRHYIPTYDYPNDRASTEFFWTVREPLNVVSNGTLIDVIDAGEEDGKKWRTYHWKMDQHYVTYLMAIAAADWEKYTDMVEIPGRAEPIETSYYVNAGVGEATARRSYDETPEMLRFFSEKIGVPYMWDKYAQATVTDFVVGGMENVSITLNTDRTLHDERAHLDRSSRGLVAHELVHQWFGDYLTCRTWAHLWLNEGFATYFECLFARHMEGEDEFKIKMWRNQRSGRGDLKNPRPIVDTFVNPKSRGRGAGIYPKGATVLNMLHRMLGEELWWKAIHHYTTKHAMEVVDTHDFEIAVREATGRNFDWFFQQYVYLAGYPAFEVSHAWENGQSKLTVKQTQEVKGLVPIFRMPVDISFHTASGIQDFQIWCDSPEQTFYFPMPEEPKLVRFDKDSWILKTLKFDKPVEMLVYQLEKDPDVVGRLEAARILDEKGKDSMDLVVPALSRTLKTDASHHVRAEAAVALGKLGGDSALAALLEGSKDPKAIVRRRCASGLGNFRRNDMAKAALETLFRKDLSYETQVAAMQALGRVDRKNSRQYALEGLEMASFRDRIATSALSMLSRTKHEDNLSMVREYLTGTHSRSMKMAAVNAMARMGRKESPEVRGQIADAIIKIGRKDRTRNRWTIINALGTLGDKKAIPFLKNIAEDSPGWERYASMAKRAIDRIEGPKETKEEPAAENKPSVEDLTREIERLKKQLESLEKRLVVPMEASGTRGSK